MKRLTVSMAIICLLNAAMADWKAVVGGIYLNSLTVGNRAQLVVDSESMLFTFPKEPSCSAYKNSADVPNNMKRQLASTAKNV